MKQIYKARRLPKQPGPAAWNELLEPAPAATELSGNQTADIVVIGAGFAGLAAARRLLQIDSALDVAVIDAGRVAEGPAGRNSGFMIDLPHDLSSNSYAGSAQSDVRDTELNRSAIRFAASAALEYEMPEEAFRQSGKINAAATQEGHQHNQDYGKHLDSLGESHRFLDAAQMKELTGSSYYHSGLYTPGTAMLQPARFIRGMAAGTGRAVRIFENSPVMEVAELSGSWQVKTRKATITTQRVILANNGHAESFGFFKRRLMHVFTYASMTGPLPSGLLGGEPEWGVTPSDPMGTTVRRINGTGGDRLLIRSRFTYNPSMTVNSKALKSAGALHDRKFDQRFPELKECPMAFRWAGHLCLSLNSVPAHGEVAGGIFAAVCQNGLGLAKGTLAGISAAEMAMGLETDITRGMNSAEPPKKLPPEPLTWIGANATMRWKEWRAGSE